VNDRPISNWEGSIQWTPASVVEPQSADDIVAILGDRERHPSPVRAIGSNHSTTRCGVADGGSAVLMRRMNRILDIGDDYVTAEAGALYIDVAKALQHRARQFHVNVELGNLTLGSAACGGTKDASMPGELGQVSSYCIGMKLVTPGGDLIEITEEDPALLQAARASYGLFGIIYEVTFRTAPLRAMSVYHERFHLEQFERRLPELIARDESMMLYIAPFLNTVTVEFRRYDPGREAPAQAGWQWRLRNWVWSKGAPLYAYLVTRYVPSRRIRYFLIDRLNQLIVLVLSWVLKGRHTVPTDQLIRYPARGGASKYTFSIWAFPEGQYTRILREYFGFVHDYYQRTGYRPNLIHVGYRIHHDESSLFSYSSAGTVITIDPVSTGDPGWEAFLNAYNAFCSERGGVPLFNQTRGITPEQARRAFGERLATFERYRRQFDPEGRLLNDYFRERLGAAPAPRKKAGKKAGKKKAGKKKGKRASKKK